MIRIIVGILSLMLVFSSLTTLEVDPTASVLAQSLLALVGLVMLAVTVPFIKE